MTLGPRLAGGDGPGDDQRAAGSGVVELELAWLLREGSELFARYRVGAERARR